MLVDPAVRRYITRIIEIEGPYGNHPHDTPTTWGITLAEARAHGYMGSMPSLTKQFAFDIYLEKYYITPKLPLINDVSPIIAEKLLDAGINVGSTQAQYFIQRVLNSLNDLSSVSATRFGPDLVIDGRIGPKTAERLRAVMHYRGNRVRSVEREIEKGLNCLQGAFYIHLGLKKPKKRSFVYGWLKNRIVMLPAFA